ncbi:hypothetical protein UCRPC4_g02954 [Phaeomoniella chlamydospora]|uniref:ELYS-like domain-containing protein n=1 Tax=Phaeomoniella chlamydospora TaxID=158046 RepID=A0A0G2EM41_PHACM|nr:hypothetical protein UCRPC4_g02954 [Phaeomoniella chlamydospora]
MLDWANFDVVFQQKPNFSYDSKTVEQIRRRRKDFDGKLFFDRILESIGLKQVTRLYPPTTNSELRTLFDKIVKTGSADYQKHALIYYILKDCSRHLSNADQQFVRQVYLPSKYLILITGLWELDRGHLSNAVDCLTDPSLMPTFTDEILYTLIKHEKPGDGLAMSYYLSVSPPLADDKVLNAYFDLLTESSVSEAYNFAQKQPDLQHRQLFERLIVSIHTHRTGEDRATRAIELVALPFTAEEEAWFEECLLYGSAQQYQNAKDTLIVRRIALGKDPGGIGALDRNRGPKIDGTNWDDLRLSLQKTKS